jgi:predicted transcriptional regulator
MQAMKEITVSGVDALKISEALNATTMSMLQILIAEHLDVTTIAKRLNLSEAYISEQVRQLEDLNMISVTYERGKRGIRKVCATSVDKIIINITAPQKT